MLCFKRSGHHWAGEVGQSMKFLSSKPEDLSSSHREYLNITPTGILVRRRQRRPAFWNTLSSQLVQLANTRPVKDPVSKQNSTTTTKNPRWLAPEDSQCTQDCQHPRTGACPHTRSDKYTCTFINTHTQARTYTHSAHQSTLQKQFPSCNQYPKWRAPMGVSCSLGGAHLPPAQGVRQSGEWAAL